MIETVEQIANRALRKLGSAPLAGLITSMTDQNAKIMNSIYDESLRYVLSEAYWGFATKRALLK